MKIQEKHCPVCKNKTVFVEDNVADKESATVWHCMVCGFEQRPDEHTDRGFTVEPASPKPSRPAGVSL
jgi:predicted nucleic acid-binding Zn ribbon protein